MRTLLERDGLRGNVVRSLVWGGALVLLALPGMAMRFTGQVRWTAEDFVFAGIMLLAVCLAYELAARRARDNRYMLAAAAQLAIGLGLAATGLGKAWVFTGLMCAAWLTAAALFARARGRP